MAVQFAQVFHYKLGWMQFCTKVVYRPANVRTMKAKILLHFMGTKVKLNRNSARLVMLEQQVMQSD